MEALGRIRSDLHAPDSGLYADKWEAATGRSGPAFMWGCGVMVSALNAAAALDRRHAPELERYVRALDVYWNPAGPTPGYDVLPCPKPVDRYYDDNVWMVLALLENRKKLVHELMRIRVRPYYIFNCKRLQGIRHFRAPVADGLNIMENLRGYTSGLAVPTFIVTAPEGKGKTPLAPTYLLNYNRNGKLLFRTWSGYVCEYEDELLEEE